MISITSNECRRQVRSKVCPRTKHTEFQLVDNKNVYEFVYTSSYANTKDPACLPMFTMSIKSAPSSDLVGELWGTIVEKGNYALDLGRVQLLSKALKTCLADQDLIWFLLCVGESESRGTIINSQTVMKILDTMLPNPFYEQEEFTNQD